MLKLICIILKKDFRLKYDIKSHLLMKKLDTGSTKTKMPKTSLPRTNATPKQNEGHQRRNNRTAQLFGFTTLDK